jgi:hypothetical protein
MRWLRPFFVLACVASGCSIPSFGYQSVAVQTLNACRDGKLSAGEADVDCGRVCNAPCASGSTCIDDLDCASVFCSVGTCTDQTCSDNLKNQDESDIDCGGLTGCAPCASGKACLSDSDCASASCMSNICLAPQTCSDKLKDQDESDVDCGGSAGCARCAPGEACASISDCDGGACTASVCHAATCSDGLKNQTESDVDCGGSCDPCAIGKSCGTSADCNLALCTGGKCRSQSCSDGLLNQDETDVDCGGTSGCARCAANQHCVTNADCDHASCSKGTCQPTSCSDGVLNGSETDVDCGGSCKGCAALAACLVAKDCESLVCTMATHKCAAPTCSDHTLNGTESAVDCGGSCPGCATGQNCMSAADCGSGLCKSNTCVPASPTGLKLSRTAWILTASSNQGQITYAIDGDPTSRWNTGLNQAPGMWFKIDMQQPQIFFSVVLDAKNNPTDGPLLFDVYLSNDGNFSTPTKMGLQGSPLTTIDFGSAQLARYIYIILRGTQNSSWWSIDEVNVFQ